MQPIPTTTVIRHRLENLKKCSLRGLENRPDFSFLTYPHPLLASSLPSFETTIILTVEAPPLTLQDSSFGLLILDGTWRYAAKMLKFLNAPSNAIYRSLPSHYKTAYPRRQEDCPDPSRGLASVEAIYLAYYLMGRDAAGILDNYYWKKEFLQNNDLIS